MAINAAKRYAVTKDHAIRPDARATRLPGIILCIYMTATSITTFYLTVFFKNQLGFSGSQIGLLYSIQAITGMLAVFPAGMGNDRFSSRTLIILSLVVQAVVFILMGVTRTYILMAGLFMIFSLASYSFRLSIDVQFLKTADSKAIGNRIGLFQAFRFFGLAAGAIMAGYYIDRLDFAASLMLVGGICLMLTLPSSQLTPTALARVRLSDYRTDFSDKKVILFSIWMLLFATHWGAEQTCYGLFLKEDLNLSIPAMGWYMASEFIAIILSLLAAGDIVQQEKYLRRIAVIGLSASGIGHMGMVTADIAVSVSFRILHGIGDGCMLLLFYYGIARLFPIGHLGGNAGLVNLVTMVGYVVGSIIYSPLGEHYGYGLPLWISGLTTLMLIPPIYYLRPTHRSNPASGKTN
jgi:MFS family permease